MLGGAALVHQIGDFSRFLEVISCSQASQLNLASLAQEAEIPRKRAESYLGILKNLLLAIEVAVLQKRAPRPPGCPRGDRRRGPRKPGGPTPVRFQPTASAGQSGEAARRRNLAFLAHPLGPGGGCCGGWTGCVLGDRGKRRARIERRDLAGLQAFGADYPQAQRWLLSLAPEPLMIDGIRCEPLEEWLRQLQPLEQSSGQLEPPEDDYQAR